MFYTNPLFGILRTIYLFLSRQVQFENSVVGEKITMADGKSFTIFRRVEIGKLTANRIDPQSLFIIRFTPKTDIKANIRLSRIMLFIFMGFKGFCSKYWCVDENTGECQGIYEWAKIEDAERYSRSIAIRNMTKRSKPGSISYQILSNTPENRNWLITRTALNEKKQFKNRYGFI